MTSITYNVSRALSRTWDSDMNIVLSKLDHDANVSPWVQVAADRGVEVRWIDVIPEEGCSLDMASLERALDSKTALVACTHASNACGTIPDVPRIIEMAHAVDAKTFIDAVHYAPHRLLSVQVGTVPTFHSLSRTHPLLPKIQLWLTAVALRSCI